MVSQKEEKEIVNSSNDSKNPVEEVLKQKERIRQHMKIAERLDQDIVSEQEQRFQVQRDYDSKCSSTHYPYVEPVCIFQQHPFAECQPQQFMTMSQDSRNTFDGGFKNLDALSSEDSDDIELEEHSQVALMMNAENADVDGSNNTGASDDCQSVSSSEYQDVYNFNNRFVPYKNKANRVSNESETLDSHDRFEMNTINSKNYYGQTLIASSQQYWPCVSIANGVLVSSTGPSQCSVISVPVPMGTYQQFEPYSGSVSEYSDSMYSLGSSFLAQPVSVSANPFEFQNLMDEMNHFSAEQQRMNQMTTMQAEMINYNKSIVAEFLDAFGVPCVSRRNGKTLHATRSAKTARTAVHEEKQFKKGQYVQFFHQNHWQNGKILKLRPKGYVVRSNRTKTNIHRFEEMLRPREQKDF